MRISSLFTQMIYRAVFLVFSAAAVAMTFVNDDGFNAGTFLYYTSWSNWMIFAVMAAVFVGTARRYARGERQGYNKTLRFFKFNATVIIFVTFAGIRVRPARGAADIQAGVLDEREQPAQALLVPALVRVRLDTVRRAPHRQAALAVRRAAAPARLLHRRGSARGHIRGDMRRHDTRGGAGRLFPLLLPELPDAGHRRTAHVGGDTDMRIPRAGVRGVRRG